jgi:CRP-like cAMP-binding protein
VCEDDCRLATISRDKALELYYQNPKFGFFLLRLMSGYLVRDRGGELTAAARV